MPKDYDIQSAFREIENELLESMFRNLNRHKAWEEKEDMNWEQWQVLQLKALEEYKARNSKVFNRRFDIINAKIKEAIEEARKDGNLEQELEILKQIQENKFEATKMTGALYASFLELNDKKLEALIKATIDDLEKAEHAMLRMANDQYRKIIFNAQVYANTGAATYEKAVDMASRDFLKAGINCIEYKNGARHTIQDYADMAIRTASKRAKLTGEGEKRFEWGIATVIMNKRGNPCPKCLPWTGKVLIDDVWSGGKAYINGKQRNGTPIEGLSPKTGKKYPLMSEAIASGLYHPRCKDGHTTYFEGITEAGAEYTREEIEELSDEYSRTEKMGLAKRNYDRYQRLEKYSLDEENKREYALRSEYWKDEYTKYYKQVQNTPRDYEQYSRYSNVLKELSPESFEQFTEIKYNDIDKWSDLKRKYRILNQYEMNQGTLSASEILKMDLETISEKRNNFTSAYKRSGNIAGAYVDGRYYIAHSKINDSNSRAYKGENTLVGLKENLHYKYINVLGKDGKPRENTFYDTEAKLFEHLADMYKKEPFERVDMLSERGMCDSCKGVMEQFIKEHPEVKVNVVSNKRVEDNVWKQRLRNKKS